MLLHLSLFDFIEVSIPTVMCVNALILSILLNAFLPMDTILLDQGMGHFQDPRSFLKVPL